MLAATAVLAATAAAFSISPLDANNCTAALGRQQGDLGLVLLSKYVPSLDLPPALLSSLERAAEALNRRGRELLVHHVQISFNDADRSLPIHVSAWQSAWSAVPAAEALHRGQLALGRRRAPQLLLPQHGMHFEWHADWRAHELVDVLSLVGVPPPSAVAASGQVLLLSSANFTRVATTSRLLLLLYTVRWCARCAEIAVQFERAARLIQVQNRKSDGSPPDVKITLAVLDMDNPTNFAMLKDRSIASFPVGKFYRRGIDAGLAPPAPVGRPSCSHTHAHPLRAGTYKGGPSASDIAQEALRRARAEETAQSGERRRPGARGRRS